MPTVFPSSTSRDLPEYRAAVLDACRNLQLAVATMEDFPAMGLGATAGSLAHLDRCDVYLGVFANRYGYVEPGHDYSVTEAEYEHAKQAGIQFHWQTRVVQITAEGLDCAGFQIPCDMVIRAIGQSPFKDFGPINRETGQTRYPKFFAGGDFINGGREVVDAVADGKRAAQGIVKWLS